MKILQYKNLKTLNTLGLNASARYFASPTGKDELIALLRDPEYLDLPKMVIGSGSNILFSSDFEGLLIHPAMMEISIAGCDEEYIYLKVGAGVVWDQLVAYAIDRGWGGLENLSWIPGCTGAAPVQNIGAYGAEAKDTITEVEYVEIDTAKEQILKGEECRFGYRDSIFKNELKSKAVIVFVTFRLTRNPVINDNYADVRDALKVYEHPTIRNVREIIIDIRKRKLPDPSIIGNAGSFFKNPVIPVTLANSIIEIYPSMKLYPAAPGYCKVPAAWLIEQCGLKGVRYGNVGVHADHALVLLAYEGATGKELIEFSSEIRRTVKLKFGIDIEPEVNVC